LGAFFVPQKTGLGSDIVEYEIMKTPDLNKRNKALYLYSVKKEKIDFNDAIEARA
jgi:hypothetical protein